MYLDILNPQTPWRYLHSKLGFGGDGTLFCKIGACSKKIVKNLFFNILTSNFHKLQMKERPNFCEAKSEKD